jgi:peptidoglycan/LPS O-acetylase OafA/YrhL
MSDRGRLHPGSDIRALLLAPVDRFLLVGRKAEPLAAVVSHPKYRPDVDGLRAIAVLSVVAFHAFPFWIRGGFIGVDVFFVISGYLISTIIFENLDKGTFSFSQFYARRIKRIFPALILVLVACFAFGWFALLAGEYKQLGKNIAAGAGFVSNFALWNEAGYFDNSAETKPLLHLWSLGIEEQFYIVWPPLVWLAWKRKFNLLAVTTLVATVSFILNVDEVKQDTVASFYSPQTRFWELSIGSLLAWVALYKARAFDTAKNKIDGYLVSIVRRKKKQEHSGKTLSYVLSLGGLLLLMYGFWGIDKDSSFPGTWALVPVFGAVLILAADSNAWFNRTILSNKVAVWFGLISFPLYLWHWPLLSFARIVESEIPGKSIRIAAVVLSIVLAWLTYRFIERPIRSGKYGNLKVTLLVVLMATIGCVGYSTYERNGLASRSSLSKISPPIERLGEDDSLAHSACMAMYDLRNDNIRYCRVSGNGKPRIALIGDSHAAALFSGLSEELKSVNNEGLLMIGGRLFVNVANYPEGSQREIDVYQGGIRATKFVAKEKTIDTVVMVSAGSSYIYGSSKFYLLSDPSITDKRKVFEIGMRETLDLLTKNNKRIIFVLDNPTLDFDPEICQDKRPLRFAKKSHDCVVPRDEFQSDNHVYRDLVFSVLKDYPSARVFDSAAYLCDERFCRAKVDGITLYGDDNHLSVAGSDYLAKELIKVINGKGSLLLDGSR